MIEFRPPDGNKEETAVLWNIESDLLEAPELIWPSHRVDGWRAAYLTGVTALLSQLQQYTKLSIFFYGLSFSAGEAV